MTTTPSPGFLTCVHLVDTTERDPRNEFDTRKVAILMYVKSVKIKLI